MIRIRSWETLLAAAAAVGAALMLPSDFYQDVAGETVTLLAIIMAAVVPAMILASNSIRSGQLSVARILVLRAALDRQVALFGGLFLYALISAVVIITGKALDWSLPSFSVNLSKSYRVHPSFVFPTFITFFLVFLSLRSLAVISGVRSVLRVSAAVAIEEAQDREEQRSSGTRDELSAYRMPSDYGAPVDLPH